MVFLKALLTLSSQGTKGSVTIIQAAKRIWVMRQPVATFFWNPADLDILERVKGRSDPTLTPIAAGKAGRGGAFCGIAGRDSANSHAVTLFRGIETFRPGHGKLAITPLRFAVRLLQPVPRLGQALLLHFWAGKSGIWFSPNASIRETELGCVRDQEAVQP
jgi:hypothetical protein